MPINWNPVYSWGLWGLVLFLTTTALALRLANLDALLTQLTGPHWWAEVVWWNVLVPLGVLAFATVGAMIVSGDPGNRLGWLALSLAILAPIADVIWQYAVRATHLVTEPLPAESLAIWLAHILTPVVLVLFFGLVLLHFPNGCLVSPRWKPLVWVAMGITVINAANGTAEALSGHPVDLIRPSALTVDLSTGASGWIHALVEYSTAGLMILAIASIFVRWRGATGLDRQRLKWLGYAGSMICLSLGSCFVAITLTGDSFLSFTLLSLDLAMFTIGVPVAIGIAILRYQLFDIDIVINRTLVYSLVMLILATAYVTSVLLLQATLGTIAGSSGIAVAASTLGVVALFQPLRTRVQLWIDRRFYRTRYDASVALARFGHAVHDEIDLDRLQLILAELITDTMRPQCVTIWVADANSGLPDESRVGNAD